MPLMKKKKSLNQGMDEGKEKAKNPQILKHVYIFNRNTDDNF